MILVIFIKLYISYHTIHCYPNPLEEFKEEELYFIFSNFEHVSTEQLLILFNFYLFCFTILRV